MIAVYAELHVKAERKEDFLAFGESLVKMVRQNEPGTLTYELYEGSEENVFVFLERYVDDVSVKTHTSSPYFREISPQLLDCLVKPPIMRVHRQLVI